MLSRCCDLRASERDVLHEPSAALRAQSDACSSADAGPDANEVSDLGGAVGHAVILRASHDIGLAQIMNITKPAKISRTLEVYFKPSHTEAASTGPEPMIAEKK